MEKYRKCKHAEKIGNTAIYVGTGCPRALMVAGTLVSTKRRCEDCERWEEKGEEQR